MKWQFSILAILLLFYAMFGAFAKGIFPSPATLLSLTIGIVIAIVTFYFLGSHMAAPPRPPYSLFGEDEDEYPLINALIKGVQIGFIGFIVGIALLSIPRLYSIISNYVIVLWNNLPTVAQLSPYVSILLSLGSFLLAVLNYRLQRRKEDRDFEEFMSKKKEKDSKIVRPTNEEVMKYTKK